MKIKSLDLKNPAHRTEYERILKRIQERTQPIEDAIRDSQRITGKDLATRVNV